MRNGKTESNKRLVEKIDEAFSTGNTDFILESMAEDVTWKMVGGATFSGKQEVREMLEEMSTYELPNIQQNRLTAERNQVVAEGTMRAVGKDGNSFEAAYCDSYLIVDGKIRELCSYVVTKRPKNG